MTDETTPDPSLEAVNGTTEGGVEPALSDDAATPALEPFAEPAVERSRFSQWLASFGLGELQDPLLTRARPPVPPRRPAT